MNNDNDNDNGPVAHTMFADLQRVLEEKKAVEIQASSLLKELEVVNARLLESERGRSNFLSNVRNEIINPLTSILGLTSSLAHSSGQVQHTQQIAALVYDEVFSLDFQLRNIFAAAEIEAGKIEPRPARVRINELIQGQIAYFQPRIRQRKVTITFQNETEGVFKTDAYMLQTIFLNLLANAIEFSQPDQKVIISTTVQEQALHLTVQDFGIGLAPADQEKIFERFRQLDTSTTKSHPGHGLGLAIVKEFVEQLNGQMQIESAKNKMTTIVVILPEMPDSELAAASSTDGHVELFGTEEIF